MKPFKIKATRSLPDHDRLLEAILHYFKQLPGVVGNFVSGSVASNTMDQDSDLDIGILFADTEKREKAWKDRWNWKIAPWFHRFDADHIRSNFVIYFFDPNIKADINLHIATDLPPAAGGPYQIIWDDSGALRDWQAGLVEEKRQTPNWGEAIHEDERFWAWLFYLYAHVNRGEYYNSAIEFQAIRGIFEHWCARLAGKVKFKSRKVESEPFFDKLTRSDLFPNPDRKSLKMAMIALIQEYIELRRIIEDTQHLRWNTSARAVEKISSLVKDL